MCICRYIDIDIRDNRNMCICRYIDIRNISTIRSIKYMCKVI